MWRRSSFKRLSVDPLSSLYGVVRSLISNPSPSDSLSQLGFQSTSHGIRALASEGCSWGGEQLWSLLLGAPPQIQLNGTRIEALSVGGLELMVGVSGKRYEEKSGGQKATKEKSGGQKATKEKSGGQKATKAQVRITVRQNRSDSKKALKNLLNRFSFQPATSNWAAQQINNKKTQLGSAQRMAKPNKKKTKSRADKWRREGYYEDQYYSERVFKTAFGDRWKTWSDNKSSSQRSHEYEWRRYSRQTDDENEYDDESSLLGSHSDRKILGLPLTGPLKIEDVKIAFRVSALKWHPDKNQGPSREMAEEKFKLCHNAYQSLCKVLGL